MRKQPTKKLSFLVQPLCIFLKDFPQEKRQLREMSSRDVTKFYTSVLLQTRRNSTQPGNVTPLKVT